MIKSERNDPNPYLELTLTLIWHRDVSDFMLVTDFRDYFSVLCWWPIFDVDAKLLMLVTWLFTNIQNLSPTHLVTNIDLTHNFIL